MSKRFFDFLAGGGELGAMVRAHDWSKTPLGPPEQWPQNLRTAVSTCLHCSFAIVIWWGRDLIMIYNDPYTSILANKHPRALGNPGRECWGEVWPLVEPMLERVLDQAKPFTADVFWPGMVVTCRSRPSTCFRKRGNPLSSQL